MRASNVWLPVLLGACSYVHVCTSGRNHPQTIVTRVHNYVTGLPGPCLAGSNMLVAYPARQIKGGVGVPKQPIVVQRGQQAAYEVLLSGPYVRLCNSSAVSFHSSLYA